MQAFANYLPEDGLVYIARDEDDKTGFHVDAVLFEKLAASPEFRKWFFKNIKGFAEQIQDYRDRDGEWGLFQV